MSHIWRMQGLQTYGHFVKPAALQTLLLEAAQVAILLVTSES